MKTKNKPIVQECQPSRRGSIRPRWSGGLVVALLLALDGAAALCGLATAPAEAQAPSSSPQVISLSGPVATFSPRLNASGPANPGGGLPPKGGSRVLYSHTRASPAGAGDPGNGEWRRSVQGQRAHCLHARISNNGGSTAQGAITFRSADGGVDVVPGGVNLAPHQQATVTRTHAFNRPSVYQVSVQSQGSATASGSVSVQVTK
jgi:hypothetical protein